jgi:tetratricopeptide (TPR) repeat protein
VVTEMKDVLCYSVDLSRDARTREIKDEKAAKLAQRFNVSGLPAMLFLEPDGEVRDFLSGYLPPKSFLEEVARIKRDERTLGSLRKKSRAAPDDLELRYELAIRLLKIGDCEGHCRELDEIARRDPQARSLAARKVILDEVLADIEKDMDLAPLYALLDGESHSELLFRGWYAAWKVEGHLVRIAADKADARKHQEQWLRASRELWKHVPEERVAKVGNGIAWALYENHKRLGPEERRFALQVAEKAAAMAPEDAMIQDTLACCLFVVGERKRAIETVKLCIELDPENPTWKMRLEDFKRASK